MALNWNWNEKIGELTITETLNKECREFTYNLYEGNAFLILIREWDEDGEKMYSMNSFFLDKTHAKNCLGLTKGYNNILDRRYSTVTKIRINKTVSKNWKDIVMLFAQAFDNIDIQIYTK